MTEPKTCSCQAYRDAVERIQTLKAANRELADRLRELLGIIRFPFKPKERNDQRALEVDLYGRVQDALAKHGGSK